MRKFIKSIIAGAALFALTVPAQAATYNINIYGASAQHLFWNDAADNFITTSVAGGGIGCTSASQASYDSKHGITRGTSCPGGHTYYIRYSSKASFDGIWAMKGLENPDGCTVDPSTGGSRMRKMVDEATCNWTTGACTALKCVDVTLGASDVAGETFVQQSHGQLKGHLGGGWVDRVMSPINTSSLTAHRPLVVPFGFFVNNSVTQKRCLGPDPTEPTASAHKAMSKWGNECYDADGDGNDAMCIGYYKCVSGTCSGGVNAGAACTRASQCPDVALSATRCASVPMNNISRLQAVMIFSGQAWYWSDFGAFFPSDPIVACLRHAGSGTHATLDAAVMRGDWNLLTTQNASEPTAWFNDGSSDEMACVNGLTGAIGYADADQLAGSSNYPNVHALNYQGVEPMRWKIRNGEYDFWSAQWIYEDPNEPGYSSLHPIVTKLIAYAANPAKIPATKADYWASQGEMVYTKATDWAYPGYTGASNPQTP